MRIDEGIWDLIMDRFFTATIAGFLFALQLSSSGVVSAGEAKARSESEWESVVKAAKAEGQLAIYANTSFEAIFPEFRKKYPEIKITYVTGVGAPDVVPRVLSEQRGGKFLGDLALLGGSGLYSLYQAKALDPLKPALMLPEVVDESKWWEVRHDYLAKSAGSGRQGCGNELLAGLCNLVDET